MGSTSMQLCEEVSVNTSKKHYEAPMMHERSEMTFTKDVWEDFSAGNWCFGCTNCNCN
jgi:hypothetical protein